MARPFLVGSVRMKTSKAKIPIMMRANHIRVGKIKNISRMKIPVMSPVLKYMKAQVSASRERRLSPQFGQISRNLAQR